MPPSDLACGLVLLEKRFAPSRAREFFGLRVRGRGHVQLVWPRLVGSRVSLSVGSPGGGRTLHVAALMQQGMQSTEVELDKLT